MSGHLFHIASVATMALTPLLNKWALQTIDPFVASFLNALIGGVFGLSLLLFSKKSIPSFKCKYLWMTALFNAAGLVCLHLALKIENPVVVGLVGRMYIPFSGIFALWLLKEHLPRSLLACLGVAFLGVLLFSWKPFSWHGLLGLVASLAFAVFFAITNTLGKKVSRNPWTTATFNQLLAAVILFPFTAYVSPPFSEMTWELEGIFLCSVSAIVGGYLGLGLFFEGLKRTSVLESSLIRCMSPIFVALYTLPFFPMSFSFTNVSGALLVLLSCLSFALIQYGVRPQIFKGFWKRLKEKVA